MGEKSNLYELIEKNKALKVKQFSKRDQKKIER
jgi:hypothetical protein